MAKSSKVEFVTSSEVPDGYHEYRVYGESGKLGSKVKEVVDTLRDMDITCWGISTGPLSHFITYPGRKYPDLVYYYAFILHPDDALLIKLMGMVDEHRLRKRTEYIYNIKYE